MRSYVLSLLRNPAFAASISESDILSVMAAGLLHDIGHYPFAHNLEALHLKGRDTPRHEDVGARIIRGEVESLRADAPICEVLRSELGVDPERVNSLCTGKFPTPPTPVDRVLRSIVSSTIDADKMDYLERDSIHLGVPYGRNYDRGRLLTSLTLNAAEDSIAVSAKGKVSAEIFVFGRYTMFSEAYWHHTVRSAAAMVEVALAAFDSRTEISPDDLLKTLLARDDDTFLRWLVEQSPANTATRYLLENMTGNRRRLYKRIATFSRIYGEQDQHRAYETIYEMTATELFGLSDRLRVRLSGLVGRPLHPADLIIDTPPRDKDRMETIDVVLASNNGQPRQMGLHEISRVVSGIQDDFVKVVKKIRVFAEPTLAAELADHDGVSDALLEEILA